jgi:hypothetical protein
MKRIITHTNPDLDAIASVWLLKKFLPDWQQAEIGFMYADKNVIPDKDPEVLYTDVGGGSLDHHKTGKFLSATSLCWDLIKKERAKMPLSKIELAAIDRLVDYITQEDNAHDMYWPEAKENRYVFYPHWIVDGFRGLEKPDEEIISLGFELLEAMLLNLKIKIRAEKDLADGIFFESKWGKAVACLTGNRHLLWHGEIAGYVLVVIKDPEQGGVKIYARPDSKVNLTQAYKKIMKMDPESDWYLHATKRLLLNQSGVNPNLKPTKLSIEEIIKVLAK